MLTNNRSVSFETITLYDNFLSYKINYVVHILINKYDKPYLPYLPYLRLIQIMKNVIIHPTNKNYFCHNLN